MNNQSEYSNNQNLKEYTFEEYMTEQKEEIKKYIWCEGVKLGHNPLEDKTENQLFAEWIAKFAVEYSNTHKIKIKS